MYHGKGGFTHTEVYNMPIWMRRNYIQSVQKAIEAQQEANKKEADRARDWKKSDTKIHRPDIKSKSTIPVTTRLKRR